MNEPLITYERALASLAEAVAAYTSNQKPSTFDAMEDALAAAQQLLKSSSVE